MTASGFASMIFEIVEAKFVAVAPAASLDGDLEAVLLGQLRPGLLGQRLVGRDVVVVDLRDGLDALVLEVRRQQVVIRRLRRVRAVDVVTGLDDAGRAGEDDHGRDLGPLRDRHGGQRAAADVMPCDTTG